MGLSNLWGFEHFVDTSSTPIGLPELVRCADGFELQKFHETCEAGSAGGEAAEGAIAEAAVAGPTLNCVHRKQRFWRGGAGRKGL